MSNWNRNVSANRRLLALSRENDGIREYRKSDGSVRHKCFLSYYSEDAEEVLAFVEKFSTVFIPKTVGISDDYPWVNSDDDDYVMDVIRDDYLADSTVTLVFIGKCTWSRKFVDWEVYSSLRRDKNNHLNGLLAIQLPSAVDQPTAKLPDRVNKNVRRDANGADVGYARYNVYPSSEASLQAWIEDAFQARKTRDGLIVLGGPRRKANSACS
ncbi:TIR domain-containing protein [Micromonospora sp. HUAS YX12]|uniref:TIR domain-containing protein n=1 Tax=Micromonospora sp. HUAS YX12 TaxID=3156396 RepID=A0AAU7R4V5_9ACTN